VSSDPITKYELLRLFKKHYRRKVEIVPDDKFKCDRSLNSTRFRSRFHYTPPAWDDMVAEIARDGEYE
jgi:dTDP-4-dehydrorhamnose reductase